MCTHNKLGKSWKLQYRQNSKYILPKSKQNARKKPNTLLIMVNNRIGFAFKEIVNISNMTTIKYDQMKIMR